MTTLVVYGSLTSPYVRRVRIVADELGVPLTFVDAFTEDGQKALRARSPIWKVPAAELDGDVIFDSRVIVDELLRRHGPGPLRAADHAARLREENIVSVVDGALDAGIKRFYLKRDGVAVDGVASLDKDVERMRACMTWLAQRLDEGRLTGLEGFGRAEIALVSALGWFRFRDTYPVDEHPGLVAAEAVWASRPSVVATIPRLA